jgi:2-amino-4-hydroxy-6-hydroxymethyldihydropteridine diphosphokinase
MTKAVLSLGSNLGDRIGYLRSAVAALDDLVLALSGVYETPAWGGPGPDYLNAALLAVDADDDPAAWLARARDLEHEAGRERVPGERFAPRTLDIDVIAVWTADGAPVVSDAPELTLPHPRAHLRAFVLRPWLEIQPYAQLPGHGRVMDLMRAEPVATDLIKLRPRPELALGL